MRDVFQFIEVLIFIWIGSLLPVAFQLSAYDIIVKRYDNDRYTTAMWVLYEILLITVIMSIMLGSWGIISMLMNSWCRSFITRIMVSDTLKWFYGCILIFEYLYMNLKSPIKTVVKNYVNYPDRCMILQGITFVIYAITIIGFLVVYVLNWFIPTYS